jgi:F-box interacting protein
MRTKSEKFIYGNHHFKFSFGYDNLNRTYKVVAFYVEVKPAGCDPKSVVKVFSLGNNSWRNIQCFPMLPLYQLHSDNNNNGVHLKGTINWIAFRDYILFKSNVTTVDQYVILSLDLSTETYTQLLLP